MILLGAYIYRPFITEGEDTEIMFYLLSTYITLCFFNIIYTLTWIISLFFQVNTLTYSKYILLTIYFICFLFFFTLPLVDIWLSP